MKRTYKQIKEEKNKQTNYWEIELTKKWRGKKEERTNEGGKERTNKWRIERTNWQMIEWKCELIERKKERIHCHCHCHCDCHCHCFLNPGTVCIMKRAWSCILVSESINHQLSGDVNFLYLPPQFSLIYLNWVDRRL